MQQWKPRATHKREKCGYYIRMSTSREERENDLSTKKKTKERKNTTTLDDNERSFSCSFFSFVFTSSFFLFFAFSKKRRCTKFRFLFFLCWIVGSFTTTCAIGWSLNVKQQDRVCSTYRKLKPCCQRVISVPLEARKEDSGQSLYTDQALSSSYRCCDSWLL